MRFCYLCIGNNVADYINNRTKRDLYRTLNFRTGNFLASGFLFGIIILTLPLFFYSEYSRISGIGSNRYGSVIHHVLFTRVGHDTNRVMIHITLSQGYMVQAKCLFMQAVNRLLKASYYILHFGCWNTSLVTVKL